MFVQHDNLKPHVANIVKEKIANFGRLRAHTSPTVFFRPCTGYHFFRPLRNSLKDRKFKNEDLFDSKPEELYSSGICAKVIDSNGEYILD